MPKLAIDVGVGAPLLDIASYARRGPGRRDRLSAAEIEHISLTVRRTPEVMIKVVNKGGQSSGAVQRHVGYIGRYGDLEIETDDGRALKGRGVGRDLLQDWDLDLDEHRRHADLASAYGRQPPRLVHKLIFSMPPGTPPDKVLTAVRNFAREEFALKHRYAMVLHTDEPQPHVHMVVKAVSEQGTRLNIRKATLRQWRADFAWHLRAQGVPANATDRAVRGASRTHKMDGIFRAMQRGVSTHMEARSRVVAESLRRGRLQIEPGKARIIQTRRDVERGWAAMRALLTDQGEAELAAHVNRFIDRMPPPYTDNEWIAAALRDQSRKLQSFEHPPR
jgi:hypothetical protein